MDDENDHEDDEDDKTTTWLTIFTEQAQADKHTKQSLQGLKPDFPPKSKFAAWIEIVIFSPGLLPGGADSAPWLLRPNILAANKMTMMH